MKEYVNMIGEQVKQVKTVTIVRYRNERGSFYAMGLPLRFKGGVQYIFTNEQVDKLNLEKYKDSFGNLFIIERDVVNPLLDPRIKMEMETEIEMERLDSIEKASEQVAKERLQEQKKTKDEIEKIERKAKEKIETAKQKSKKGSKGKASATLDGKSQEGESNKVTATTLEGDNLRSEHVQEQPKGDEGGKSQNATEGTSGANKGKSKKGKKKGK